nr:transducin/WD40 repeat-like superfamily protein [Tanacetum cinerariifolium]
MSDVIDVDSLPDNVEPANVLKAKDTTAEQRVVASDNNNVTNLTLQEHSGLMKTCLLLLLALDTILNPAMPSGPKGLITIPSAKPFPIGVIHPNGYGCIGNVTYLFCKIRYREPNFLSTCTCEASRVGIHQEQNGDYDYDLMEDIKACS